MKSTDWFAIQRLRRGVYLISEPMHVKSNLIVGSRRTVLFDTGLVDTGSIRSQVDDATAHEAGVEHHRAGPPPAWLSDVSAQCSRSSTTTTSKTLWTVFDFDR